MNLTIPSTLREILLDFKAVGFKGLLVGGCVRDAMMGYTPKDIDIEVYGVNYFFLSEFLRKYDRNNKPSIVGRDFGVIKIKDNEGNDYDFSIPRRESCNGVTHKDFTTDFDPNITPQEAASRRDFTINAILYDPLENLIFDYFNGQKDIEEKRLTAINYHFVEDPLRVFRGLQFSARFGFTIDTATASICRHIIGEIYEIDPEDNELKMGTVSIDGVLKPILPLERIAEEWNKFFRKSVHPEVLIDYLIATDLIGVYPEIENVLNIEQDTIWHPEGNCGLHMDQCLENSGYTPIKSVAIK